MNMKRNPTIDQLRDLLVQKDDENSNHIIWVDQSGDVHVDALRDDLTPADWAGQMEGRCAFRLETCQAGTGHVGPAAAQDDGWTNQVVGNLTEAWNVGIRDGDLADFL